MRKIYAETVDHTPGTYYTYATNTTPDSNRSEVIARAEGKPAQSANAVFNPDEWALVLRGISPAKAHAIVMILNAPED